MESNIFHIICSGNELSYGQYLHHLFMYNEDKEVIYSHKYEQVETELFSKAVYENSSMKKDSTKIYLGSSFSTQGNILFNQYGITIKKYNNCYYCSADPTSLKGEEYNKFISFSNAQYSTFLSTENEYINNVNELNCYWLFKEFKPKVSKGIFSRKMNEKQIIKQQYKCLALIMYNDILN